MRKPIYANQEHQQAIETYLILCEEFVKETIQDQWKKDLGYEVN